MTTYQETVGYDAQKLADEIKKAMGDRSMIRYAELSGISYGYLSKLVNKKLPNVPSKRTLARLTNQETVCPQNGVKYVDLCKICHYDVTEPGDSSEDSTMPEQPENTTLLGMNIIIKHLMTQQLIGQQLSITMQPGYVHICDNQNGSDFVVLPAFDQGDDLERERNSIKLRMILALDLPHGKNTVFYIITDKPGIYDYLIHDFPLLPTLKGYAVLSRNKESISQQCQIGVRGTKPSIHRGIVEAKLTFYQKP